MKGGKTGSDIVVEAREVTIKATFAFTVGVRVKQPEKTFQGQGTSLTIICLQ